MCDPRPWAPMPKPTASRWIKVLIILYFCFIVCGAIFFALFDQRITSESSRSVEPTASSTAFFRTIEIRGKSLVLEVVSSTQDIEQGLSDRQSMAHDHGMLFVFSEPSNIPFWMNRMNFPLDIVWLRDGLVVDIAKNMPAPASSYSLPAIHKPKAEADMVLELNAGQAEAYEIKEGSVLEELVGL